MKRLGKNGKVFDREFDSKVKELLNIKNELSKGFDKCPIRTIEAVYSPKKVEIEVTYVDVGVNEAPESSRLSREGQDDSSPSSKEKTQPRSSSTRN